MPNHTRILTLISALGLSLACASVQAEEAKKAAEPAMPPAGTYGKDTQEQGNPVAVFTKTTKKKCDTCAVITKVEKVEQKAKGSGLGAVGGAVVGGVLGHQVGEGRGKTLATIAGAGGGAFLGNEVEKRLKGSTVHWTVSIKRDKDGAERNLEFPDEPTLKQGDRVKFTYKK